MCKSSLLPVVAMVLVACSLAAQEVPLYSPFGKEEIHRALYDSSRNVQVSGLRFSPNNEHLLVCYGLPPRNRPGTDWKAWAVEWDLKTDKPTVIEWALPPMAYSADSKLRALTIVRPSKKASRAPEIVLAVHRFEDGVWRPVGSGWQKVAVAAFHPDGKRLAVVTVDGAVQVFPLDKDGSKPMTIDILKVPPGNGRGTHAPILEFEGKGEHLSLTTPDTGLTKLSRYTWMVVPEGGLHKKTVADLGGVSHPAKFIAVSLDGRLEADARPLGQIIIRKTLHLTEHLKVPTKEK